MREHAHQLLDRLDADRLAAVVHLIEAFLPEGDIDGDATEDSLTLSPAEAKAIAEADEWCRHNAPIPHEHVLAEFGLSMADWEKMSLEP